MSEKSCPLSEGGPGSQRRVPSAADCAGAILVSGASIITQMKQHRSEDADHIVANLHDQFEAILAELEEISGWKTARTGRPELILGSLDGITKRR